MNNINIEEIKKLDNFSIKDFDLIEQIEMYSKETGDISLNMKICPYAAFKRRYPEIKTNTTLSDVKFDDIKDDDKD